jgi:hypothetical protein
MSASPLFSVVFMALLPADDLMLFSDGLRSPNIQQRMFFFDSANGL